MKLFYLLIALLSTAVSASQNCTNTISGYVIDLHDNEVLAGATLIIAGSETAVTTDENGYYTITGLCEATYTLQVSHPACETQVVRVPVSGTTTRTINMEHHLKELGEVVIEGEARKTETKTSIESLLSVKELEANSSKSLGDALKSLSGVSSLNTGNTVVKPVIQGLHSSRIILINDGTRLQDQEWGVEHAPNIDVNSAGSASVIKGAAGLQYGGDAVGGTIILTPQRIPVKDTLYGKTILTAASNGRGGSITSGLTKSYNSGWYGTLQATLKRFGDFEAPDYILSNTGMYERDFLGRLGINKYRYGLEASFSIFKNDIGILRASHLGGAEDQVIAINSQEPLIIEPFTYDIGRPRQEVTHQTAKLNAFYRFENLGKLTTQYDFQKNDRIEFDVRRDSEDTRPSIDLELITHSLTSDFEYTANNTITAKAGVVGRAQKHTPNPSTGVRRLIPDYENYELGAYVLGAKEWELWTLEAGIRYDFNQVDAKKFYRNSVWEANGYDEQFSDLVIAEFDNQLLVRPVLDYHNISATLGAAYALDDNYQVAMNYSLASRSPNVSELFSDGLHHSAARIERGDFRFDQEHANKITAAFQKTAGNWRFTVAPFANFINDFILIEPTGVEQTIRGNFQVWQYRQTNARLVGIDIDSDFRFSENIRLNNQFSLVKGEDTVENKPLINIPAANTRNAISYLIPSINNLTISLESYYVFRQNEFPDTNFEVFLPQTETVELVDVSTPPPAYHLLNFDSSIDFKINDQDILQVGLAVSNILNTSYRDYLNRTRYYADDLGRNFIVQLKLNY